MADKKRKEVITPPQRIMGLKDEHTVSEAKLILLVI